MQDQMNKPVFVVGSPRSGTSILTWCLGQHPNMFPVPESNWMGDFAISVAIGHQIGAARGDRSILSAMDISQDELFAILGRSINDLILRHRKDLERKRQVTSEESERKGRWVDGTPEYSFHICGLRKLFPKALFIHLVRDVRSVVRSMLNFHPVAGHDLVNNEQEAYNYWFRTVSSCLLAERAYGPRVVLRLRYSDLLNAPEIAMRSVLEFIGERYTTACLNPLEKRINSSNVPIDFEIDNSRTDPALLERTARLCTEIEKTPQPIEVSPAASDEIEAAFNERVKYVASLNSEYQRALQVIAALQKETAQRTAGCIDRQSDSKTEQARSTACAAREVKES
jgi:hypothetical protein